jgi:phosphoglycolate phosphatase
LVNAGADVMEWLKHAAAFAFDKDGTFIDFTATWGAALNRVIDDFAADSATGQHLADMLGFDRERIVFDPHSLFVGGSQDVYGPRFAELLGEPFTDAFTQRMAESFDRHVFASLRMIDGARQTLETVRRFGLPMSVATNDSIHATRRQLSHLRIEHLFDFVAGYDSGHGAKPGGGMISAFALAKGIDPQRIVMVGDSINDALAARDAGTRIIGLRTGPEAHPDFEALCDVVLDSIGALPTLIEQARG